MAHGIYRILVCVVAVFFCAATAQDVFAQSKSSSNGEGYTRKPDESSELLGITAKSSGDNSAAIDMITPDSGSTARSHTSAFTDSFLRLLQIVLVLGAMITLVLVIFDFMSGRQEAGRKLAWWFAGLTLGFVFLSIIIGLTSGFNNPFL